MAIRIPVSAEFNNDELKQQLSQITAAFNQLGAEARKVSGVKFTPISKASVDDARRMNAEFERMLRISGGLRRNLQDSGQAGKPWHEIQWSQVFPEDNQRQKYARTLANRLREGSVTGHAPIPPAQAPATGGFGAAMGGIAQTGLRAAGPVGGVAAGALGTGMSAGFGAGLMGLMGGIVALGVGKIVGAATEKMGEAEDNAVAYDRLKRAIGDVNVSFEGLKTAITTTADANNLTYKEAAKLSTEFARLGNLSGEQYKAMGGEVGMGIGLARGFGLDPFEGVGVLGRMRGIGVTRNEQDTKRFALLIGETIGKAGAFAKADEVMAAIGDYATMQTRNTLGGVNVGGFAGMFAGLIGSGIPGLDPAGAGGLLNRVNTSLTAGGAKGEASQYFTAMVGKKLGLNPIQTQMLREGGAFSTNNKTFGSGSIWARFMGETGPEGDTTHLSGQLETLRGAYGYDKGQLAQATANHLGVSLAQAMALHLVKPGEMGEMAKYADLSGLSGDGISNMSKALFGSASERAGLADSLYRRTGDDALTPEQLAKLEKAFPSDGSGNAETQKAVLAELIASRDKETTQGKDIHDSKVALDNLKTNMADKLIPLTQDIRQGILHMAGGGKMSGEDVLKSIAQTEYDLRKEKLSNEAKTLLKDFESKQAKPEDQPWHQEFKAKQRAGTASLADEAAFSKKLSEFNAQLTADWKAKKQSLDAERDEKLKPENAWLTAEKARIDEAVKVQREQAQLEDERRKRLDAAQAADKAANGPGRFMPSGGDGNGFSGAGVGSSALYAALLQQESGGRHRDKNGNLITSSAGALGISQIMPATGRNPGYGILPLQNDSEEEYLRVGREYLDAMLERFGGDRSKALAAYNAGEGTVRKAISKHGDNWLQGLPKETQNYVPSVLSLEQQGTPMPAEARAAQRNASANRESYAPLSGEMSLSLGLSAEAQRLLQAPQIPLTTRIASNFYA